MKWWEFSFKCVLGVALLVSGVARAQEASQSGGPTEVEIEHFHHRWMTLAFSNGLQSVGLQIQSSVSDQVVRWEPNVRTLTGVTVHLRDYLSLGISSKSGLEDRLIASRGRTDYLDLRTGFSRGSFYGNVFYQDYRGFFVSNSEGIRPGSTQEGTNIQDRDLSIKSHGLAVTYVLSADRYSYSAATDLTQRQNKTGGSWLLGGDFSNYEINSPNGLVPQQAQGDYGMDRSLTRVSTSNLLVKFGYGAILVEPWLRRFYLAGQISLGLGYSFVHFQGVDFDIRDRIPATKVDISFGLGANGDEGFVGMRFSGQTDSQTLRSVMVTTTQMETYAFFGQRF